MDSKIQKVLSRVSLREKRANVKFFLVRIQSEYRKSLTRKNSIFGQFSCSVCVSYFFISIFQKQPSKNVLNKSCSENMQQIYRKNTHAGV